MDNSKFTAKVYCNEEMIASKTGDDIDDLFAWMIGHEAGNFGDVHGQIIDNNTLEVVKVFRKSYQD